MKQFITFSILFLTGLICMAGPTDTTQSVMFSQTNYNLYNYGDRYYNENGEDLRFEILGKQYSVGYSYITEDADDWAQAECYQVEWCDCDEKPIDRKIVYDLIQNYKSEIRDTLIDEII